MAAQDLTKEISRRLGCDAGYAEAIVRAVLATVRDGLDDDEARKVASHLPEAIAALIPSRSGERLQVPETGGRGFLAVVRTRAGFETDLEAARAIHATFAAMMEASGVTGASGAWEGLRHLPPELKTIWMRIFRAATFPVERLAQRP